MTSTLLQGADGWGVNNFDECRKVLQSLRTTATLGCASEPVACQIFRAAAKLSWDRCSLLEIGQDMRAAEIMRVCQQHLESCPGLVWRVRCGVQEPRGPAGAGCGAQCRGTLRALWHSGGDFAGRKWRGCVARQRTDNPTSPHPPAIPLRVTCRQQ